jgi:hypothetical protein
MVTGRFGQSLACAAAMAATEPTKAVNMKRLNIVPPDFL